MSATPAQAVHAAPPTGAEPIRPRGLYARTGKRALDLALVLPALPFALAIGLPVAAWNAWVFRDLRKVFFVQERVGLGGEAFQMVKFRTMREPRGSAMDSWFQGGDQARVTRFGRFLRNMHLDELPQLINILRGDMHLVGPRPEMRDIHDWAASEVPGFGGRLAVRPGLTGLAQVTQGYTGASAECYAEKLAIDLEYIRGLSFAGDVGVVLRTIPWVLQGRGWSWNRGSKCSGAQAAPAAEPAPVAQSSELRPADPGVARAAVRQASAQLAEADAA